MFRALRASTAPVRVMKAATFMSEVRMAPLGLAVENHITKIEPNCLDDKASRVL